MKWEEVKLRDVCVSIYDGTHQAPPKQEDGLPFITISNVDKYNKIDFTDTAFVSKEYYESIDEKRKARKGDILYTVVGSFGIPVYLKKDLDFVFQRHIAILKPSNKIDGKFLYYTMLSREFYMQADSMALGAAQRTITLNSLRNMTIKLPSLEMQNRIASIFSSYDDLIENNQKQIKLLEEAAQRLYKEWFVDLLFPGHEDVEIVDGLPVGWEKVTMDSVAEYLNGFAFKPDDWNVTGKPIIKIKEMTEGISNSTPRNDGVNVPEKYNIKKGDILFSWSATLTAMIWDDEDGLLNQHLFKVTPRKNVSREFMLQSILLTLEEFKNLTTGSTMKHIQRGKLKEVYINMPSTDVMKKFANIAEPIREEVLNIKHKIIYLKEVRDRLLPKLMSGEVEV